MQPYFFYLNDKEVFGFAGLYEVWADKEIVESLEIFTIIKTEANDILKPIHDQKLVIIASEIKIYGSMRK